VSPPDILGTEQCSHIKIYSLKSAVLRGVVLAWILRVSKMDCITGVWFASD
jgi:hypothetical protein